MAKDYYKILGVSKNSTKEEISKAYKILAKKFHPDINKDSGATAKFKEINEAYDTLGDEQKRKNYDNFGSADGGGFGGFGGSGFGQNSGGFHGFEGDDLGDFFSEMFGFGGGQRSRAKSGAARGNDIQIVLTISLEDSFFGLNKKTFKINTYEKCTDCGGKGGSGGQETCGQCRGSGMQSSSHGFVSFASTCAACGGAGQKIAHSCKKCGGNGRVNFAKNIEVSIPQGVDNGMTLKFGGLGEAGMRGGGHGDLLITIQIKENVLFKRQKNDLIIEKTLTLKQIICGDRLYIKGIDGKEIEAQIPSNLKPGDSVKISKMGMPNTIGTRGDLIINISLESKSFSKDFQNDFAKIWDKYC